MQSIIQVLLIIFGIGFVIVIHEFGHFIVSKIFNVKVLEFMIGLPGPKLFTFKKGETTFGITAILFGGYVKSVGSDPYEKISEKDKKRSLEHLPFTKKTLIVLAGPTINVFIGMIILISIFSIIGFPHGNTNEIGEIREGYPAIEAGLKQKDKIISVNGIKTNSWNDLVKEISKKPEKTINLKIKRESSIKNISLKTKDVEGEGKIGIVNSVKYKRMSLISSTKKALNMTSKTVEGLARVIWDVTTGKPKKFLNQTRGIVGVVHQTYGLVTSPFMYFFIVALLSIVIGLINLLPIPPLDGGKIAIYLFELLKGKRLKRKTLMSINTIGAVFLLLLFVFFTVKDFNRIIQTIYSKIQP